MPLRLRERAEAWCHRGSRQRLIATRRRAADEGTTLTALLADGLRLRLARRVPPASSRRPLPVSRNRGGMQPWIDPGSNASLLDAADDDSAPA